MNVLCGCAYFQELDLIPLLYPQALGSYDCTSPIASNFPTQEIAQLELPATRLSNGRAAHSRVAPCLAAVMSTGIFFPLSISFVGGLLAITQPAMAVDVYSSIDANGAARWSTQALDDSYHRVITTNKFPPSEREKLAPTLGKVEKTNTSKLAQRRLALYPLVETAALRAGLDINMVMALIEVESGFDTQAVSSQGAHGLMQLMPKTAAVYGMRDVQELHDPEKNLDIGTRHLKSLLALHGGQWALALASYNAGQGAVAKSGQRIPHYAETMLYVPAVLAKASSLAPATESRQPRSQSSIE